MSRVREMAADGFVCVMHRVTRRCLYVGSSDHNAIGYLDGPVVLGFGVDGETAKNNARWECVLAETRQRSNAPPSATAIQSGPCLVSVCGRFAGLATGCEACLGHTSIGARFVRLQFGQRGIALRMFVPSLAALQSVYKARRRKLDGAAPDGILLSLKMSPLENTNGVLSFPVSLVSLEAANSEKDVWELVFRWFFYSTTQVP